MLSALKHPHIIRLLEVHFLSGVFYFVMEYAEGGPLVKHIYNRCVGLWLTHRRQGSCAMPWPGAFIRQACGACRPQGSTVHCQNLRSAKRPYSPACSEGGLPEAEALRIFMQITSALEYCHNR